MHSLLSGRRPPVRSVVFLLLALSTLIHGTLRAAPVNFAWDYSTSGAAGFALHCGQASRQYTTRFDAGNAKAYTVSGLTEGIKYYCAVAAYDSSAAESPYSNEIAAAVPYSAPSVGFNAGPMSGAAPLDVTFANTTTGTVTTWSWDFGDGTSSTGESPVHTYSSPGSYIVQLTATGPGGSVTKTALTPISVTAAAPVPAFAMTPASGAAPLNVTFTNTTSGSVTAWAWDFGDGTTSTLKTPGHSYSNPGSYTVKLTATGPGGSATKTASTPITVTAAAPVTDFTMTPTTGVAPLKVAFSNTTTGTATKWAWDFGDGTTGTAKNPSHSYSNPGSYTVKLTATGPGGSTTVTASTAISVSPAAPVAKFAMTPKKGKAPLNVTFTNNTTGTATAWAWDFGDGTTSTAQNPIHTYTNPGSYTVTLTATGPGGSTTKTATTPISVSAAAAPVAKLNSTPKSGVAALDVTFGNTTRATLTMNGWDFGDGTTRTARSAIHTYPGSRTVVELTAIVPGTSASRTGSSSISTIAAAPPASATTMIPLSGLPPPTDTLARYIVAMALDAQGRPESIQ